MFIQRVVEMYYDSEEEFKREYILTLSKFKPALEEAMNTKMKSFKCDWVSMK